MWYEYTTCRTITTKNTFGVHQSATFGGSKWSTHTRLETGTNPFHDFVGSPGIGKTTLATIIAQESERPFYTLSAINSGVKDVREVIEKAKQSGDLFTTKNPILFIDEIHRFSKSQQDSLLQAVEKRMGYAHWCHN